jgi:NAD(P)-dependent dehydrogenase (short-subunit alcohol dehydrogenase family)
MSDAPFRLDGRIALVTGGASGIGEATCQVLTRAGARVIVADIDYERATALAAGLAGSTAVALDVTDEASINAALKDVPRLDILVNNAGIGFVGGIEETGPDDFRRLMLVNVEGTMLVTRAAITKLLAVNGTIVNIGSVAGLVGLRKRFAYCTTKGAVIAMSRQLAVEYAGRLRVNVVCPGTVDTPFVEGFLEKFHSHEKEKVRGELRARQPMGRLGRPDEIANMVLYLCSREAEFVTGSIMTIDGGMTAV